MDTVEALKYLNKTDKPSHISQAIERWKDVYFGMSLHISGACPRFKDLRHNRWVTPPYYFGEDYQYLFDTILFSRHPRENEETRWWRFSQYKPLTRAPFQQVIDVLAGSIFQDSQYTIELPNEDDLKFIWSNEFDGHDLIGWMANVCLPNMMEDPNGIVVRMPTYKFDQQTGQKVDVSVFFVNSKDIVYPYDGNELMFYKDGYVYHINKLTIWRYSLDEKKKKYIIAPEDIDGYYSHMLNKVPFDIAGGIWNTQGFYDSYLMKAKPIADEYVSSYSSEQMVDKEASHPFITMVADECPECKGIGKVQIDCEECTNGVDLVKCDTCYGKGTISHNPSERIVAPVAQMDKDLIKITNPDTGINKYHHDKNKEIFVSIMDALNLIRVDQAQSGTAKAIDQERLYQFLSKVSNHLFDKIIYGTISDIIAYRNVTVTNGQTQPANYEFSIQKPTQFQIKTATDLLEDYKSAKESGMPIYVRQKMMCDFVEKEYSGDPIMMKKSDIILQMDKLAVLSPDEILTKQTLGEITKQDAAFSLELPIILDNIIRDKGQKNFIKADYDTIDAWVNEIWEPIETTTQQYETYPANPE